MYSCWQRHKQAAHACKRQGHAGTGRQARLAPPPDACAARTVAPCMQRITSPSHRIMHAPCGCTACMDKCGGL